MSRSTRPIVLLAFADPRRDLGNLKDEVSGLRDIFWPKEEFVETIFLDHPSVDQIVAAFQRYRNRIVAFHYGGHASGFELLLEDSQGNTQSAGASGLAQFLGGQRGLELVFLNGCSTRQQVQGLMEANVGCVIATTRAIDDRVATQFAKHFYRGLINGGNLQTAFAEASAATQSANGDNTRALYAEVAEDEDLQPGELPLPWEHHTAENQALDWSFDLASRRRRRAIAGGTTQEKGLLSLIDRVKKAWVQGILARSTGDRPRLELAMKSRPDAVEDTWEEARVGDLDSAEPIPNASMIDVFEDSGRSLLILGQPGSGKTTAMLELTKELVLIAGDDENQPVPAVLHLSSWDDNNQSMKDWILEELSNKYSIARRVSQSLLENQRLILLLDGLDETDGTSRIAIVNAIHQLLDQIGTAGIVVCCRVEEYFAIGERLRLHTAVCLEPLGREQIISCLNAPSTGNPMLASMLKQHDAMIDLASSPLMFDLMREAYQDETEMEVAEFESVEQCRGDLFDRYVNKMFAQRLRKTDEFDRKDTLDGLNLLSRQMLSEGSAIFLLELLQPSSIRSPLWRWAYRALVAFGFGLIIGMVVTFFFESLTSISNDTGAAMTWGLRYLFTPMFIVWFGLIALADGPLAFVTQTDPELRDVARVGIRKSIVFTLLWLVVWLPVAIAVWSRPWESLPGRDQKVAATVLPLLAGLLGAIMVAAFGINRRVFDQIRPVEAIRFSWRYAKRGMLWGGGAGLVLWLLHTVGWPTPNIHFWYQPTQETVELERETAKGAIIYLIALLMIGVQAGGIVGGLVPTSFVGKTKINQGMRLSLVNALKAGLTCSVAVTITMLFLIVIVRERDLASNYSFALATGLLTLFCTASWFGGFGLLKHVALRAVLRISKQLPEWMPHFLRHADRLRFMYWVEGGYMFIHRSLLEYFANKK